jgi:ribokinase
MAPVGAKRPNVAVVGHVEWVQFARVAHVPDAGEVVHAGDPFEEPAGAGAVVAAQLARLAGSAALFTSLGRDDLGERAIGRLRELGVVVHASRVAAPTRRAFTLLDDSGERTITTLGPRLEPLGEAADIAWDELVDVEGVFFTAGDLSALRAARAAARVLVASPRAGEALGHGVPLDALVMSAEDSIERRAAAHAERDAELLVMTEGARGGTYRSRSGSLSGRWAAVPAGEPVDAYGCGDSFAAGLTFGLAAGMEVADALRLAARCGAACAIGRGPYGSQLGGSEPAEET